MKTITDFKPSELRPDFIEGIDSVHIQSSLLDVRAGLSITPNGNVPAGLSIHNATDLSNHGYASLLIHPDMADSLVLSSSNIGTGLTPTKFKITLDTIINGTTTVDTLNADDITANSLNLRAGTYTRAQLHFDSSTLKTSPVTGDVEYSSGRIYMTNSTGREEFSMISANVLIWLSV